MKQYFSKQFFHHFKIFLALILFLNAANPKLYIPLPRNSLSTSSLVWESVTIWGVNKKSTSLRLNSGLYAYIEKLAKKENRSINNYIETLLFDAVDYHEPNKETKLAMKEIEKEKGSLKRYASVDDLFNDLENE